MDHTQQHKILLQTFLQEGILDENRTKDLVIKLFNTDKVSTIINQINGQLQPIDMLIKHGICEITGQQYWVLIITIVDEITRFQDEFSKAQLALLRNIFSEIIVSNNGYIPSTRCLNLSSLPDVKLPKTEAEKLLMGIVKRKWLVYKNGYCYMGVRSITELMPYFKATYEGNLNTCCLCQQVIFYGGKCQHCESLLHLYCLKNFSMIHNPVKCPSCNNIFEDIDLSGVSDESTTLSNKKLKVQQCSKGY